MIHKQYTLRYLPLFAEHLQNPKAAEKLIADTEKAILQRLKAPCAFQPYPSA